MRTLLIDDERNLKANMICRDYDSALAALTSCGPWDLLYLDHDLGEADGKTGYDIMCFLEENQEYLPNRIVCVSSNAPGRARIEMVIKKLGRDVSEREPG